MRLPKITFMNGVNLNTKPTSSCWLVSVLHYCNDQILLHIFHCLVFQYFIAVLFDELIHLPVTLGLCKGSTVYQILDQIIQLLS